MPLRPNGRGTPSGFPHLRRPPLPFIEAPPGGPIYQPPRRSSTASAKIKHPSSSTTAKGSQQNGAGRPPAPRSNRRHRTEGRKGGRLEEGPPLKSQMVDLDLASSEMARLAKVGTGRQRRRSAPRTHDHAQGRGLGRPTLENASTAHVCGRNPPTRHGRRQARPARKPPDSPASSKSTRNKPPQSWRVRHRPRRGRRMRASRAKGASDALRCRPAPQESNQGG